MAQIAIVEHEALVALDIAKTLQRAGYEISGPYSGGSEFLDALGKGLKPSLALIDVELRHGVSGIDAAISARMRAGIPSVLISALSDPEILAAAKGAQPLGILVKPFSERELLGTAEIALFRADMERKLSYSEKRYRELFDLSLAPRCISDVEGRIVEANASFRSVFAIPGSMPELPSLFGKEEDWNRVRKTILAERTIDGLECEMLSTAGQRLSILASFSGFREAGKDSLLLSSEFFDLTEAHRLRDELQQSQKMDAMGRLAGGIAHDFNNILTAIVGHAEMLKMDIKPQDSSYEDVEGIARTAGRASQLTRQLLGFSRKQPYSPKAIGLASVVKDTAGLLRKLSGEMILFSTILPKNDPIVFADPIQIEQALINLVVNARDALDGKSGARITVLVEERELKAARKIGAFTLPPGRYAAMEVSDNGSGIPEDVAAKIFEPFFTTKAMGKGTGLGLAIVSTIAAQVRGAIGLISSIGKGSAFTLWLPLSLETGPRQVAEEAGKGDLPKESLDLSLKGNPSILLVDDDESLLGFLAYVLSKAGASVVSARNAGEALLQAEKRNFDILVLDINLPGLDGLGLHERLSAKTGVKCVFISGRIDSDMKIPEGTILLEKPFTPWELVSSLRAMLPL